MLSVSVDLADVDLESVDSEEDDTVPSNFLDDSPNVHLTRTEGGVSIEKTYKRRNN